MASNGEESENRLEDQGDSCGGGGFFIPLENETSPKRLSAPPRRLTGYTKKLRTQEQLEQKLMEAHERRKEHEQERIARTQQQREDVVRLNTNFSALLEQDAKVQGYEGTSDVAGMTRQELKNTFQAANRDYKRMAVSMVSTVAQIPKQ